MTSAQGDLIARLRDSVIFECGEAADRIEALEAEVVNLRSLAAHALWQPMTEERFAAIRDEAIKTMGDKHD